MSEHSRYAIYYVPPPGAFADWGAAWLGWDAAHGKPQAQPAIEEIAEITATPRKYGFHATLKPPFRLAEGQTRPKLQQALSDLAVRTAPGICTGGLHLTQLGRFLALVPQGDVGALGRVAAACVAQLDVFRAPPGDGELKRRRAAGLNPAQEALLRRWGYPYVMTEFRFHMTLTGALPAPMRKRVMDILNATLPSLPTPFTLDAITLLGERPDGYFETLHRYALRG